MTVKTIPIVLLGLVLASPLRAALRLSSGGKAMRRLFPSGKNLTKRSPVSPGLLLPSQSHVPSWLCQTAASGWHQFRSASAFCLPSGSPSVLSGTKAVPASNKGLPLPSAWKLHLSVWSPFFYPPQKPWFLSAAV